MTVSLCLMTWNEVAGCGIDLPRLPVQAFDEVFAVDHDSTDGTVALLREAGVRVCPQQHPTYNGAYRTAFEACRSDMLVFFHPKGTIDPAEIATAVSLLREGHDLAIASRMLPGARNEEDARLLKPRKWFVLLLAGLAALRWRRNGPLIRDVLHGFRGVSKELMNGIAMQPGVDMDLRMVVYGYQCALKMAEFPVCEVARGTGTSHFPALATGRQLLSCLAREWNRGCGPT